MAALSILCDSEALSAQEIRKSYTSVQRRAVNEEADTLCFENVFMMLHNVEALAEMDKKCESLPIIRSAIIAWYYTIYYAARAMIAATSGARPETHTETARLWHADIVGKGYALGPFGFHLDGLVPKNVKTEVSKLRNGNSFTLTKTARTESEAKGACIAYLSGTANYEKWKVEENIRTSPDFKQLGVTNFQTKKARELRDPTLSKKSINFMTQAFRYRGKANYRDSIYLSYGARRDQTLKAFLSDLENVGSSFAMMACHYMSRRVEKGAWTRFVEDLEQNSQIRVRRDVLGV